MPNLSVRKLNKTAYEQLRLRAAAHGLSMEEEARQIIYQAVSAPKRLSDTFKKYFGLDNGIDLITPDHYEPHQPLDFEE